jgi:hypothetical protein
MNLDIVMYGKTGEVVIGEMPAEEARDLLIRPFDIYQIETPGWREMGTFYHKNGLLLPSEDETVTIDIHRNDKKVAKDFEIPGEQMRIEEIRLDFTPQTSHAGVLCGSVKKGVIYFALDDLPLDYDEAKLVFYADRIEGQGLLIYQVVYEDKISFQEEVSSGDYILEPVFFK